MIITLPSLNEITTATNFKSVNIKVHFDIEDSIIKPVKDKKWVGYDLNDLIKLTASKLVSKIKIYEI